MLNLGEEENMRWLLVLGNQQRHFGNILNTLLLKTLERDVFILEFFQRLFWGTWLDF